MNPASRRRAVLSICTFCALAAALVGSVMSSRSAVERSHKDLLAKETAMAVELFRATQDSNSLRKVFESRWRIESESPERSDEVLVRDTPSGLVAAATIYDTDSWFAIGTLRLESKTGMTERVPTLVLLLNLLALAGLGFLSYRVVLSHVNSGFRRFGFPLLVSATLCLPLSAALSWAMTNLNRASEVRMNASIQTLKLIPNFDSLAAMPGGISRVAGAQSVLSDGRGNVEFTTLPTAATRDLIAAKISGVDRVIADEIEYLAADVSRARLAVLPYDQLWSPAPKVCVFVLIGLLLAALPVYLAGLVDQPRVFYRNVIAWSFLAPATVHLAIFTLAPLANAAWLSLHRWSLIDAAKPFVGLDNYWRLLENAAFWNAIKNTVIFTLHVPASMVIALSLALIVQRRARGIVFLRAMLFLPTITSLVAVAMVWQWMLHDEYGLFNWMLSLFGIDPVGWLSSPSTALLSIMIMATWLVVGYQMILFQAGLAAIPSDLYDSARIDGANCWRRFWHVTLPGLRHTLFFVLVTSVIGSFQVFGAVYVMTEGGPLHATDVAVFHIYEEAWEYFRFGDAAAMSWVLFALVFFATWLQFRTLERKVGTEA